MLEAKVIEQSIISRFPDAVEETSEISGIANIYVRPESIVDVCSYLKSDPAFSFDYLFSLSAIDLPDRFDVVYHLYSVARKHYVILKVKLQRKDPVIASTTAVWKAADWQEREVYDMFGIEFTGHPDLRRILLEPDWEGFPLRKDYVEK